MPRRLGSSSALAALALLLFVASLPTPVAAQSVSYGTLAGTVLDRAGQPVAEASVRLVDPVSGATRQTVTTREGAFRFGVLGPAAYDLTVEALAYRPVVLVGVTVSAGAQRTLRVTIQRERPPVVRVDTVRAAGAHPEPGSWMYTRGYAELAGGRRLATDAALLSPVADGASVEGLSWRYANTYVDGSEAGAIGGQGLAGDATSALATPSRGLAAVSAGGTGYDVETGGSGVGLLARSLRGGGTAASKFNGYAGNRDVGGGVVLSGPLQGDTAQAIIGIDYQRTEISRPEWFVADDAVGLAIANAAGTTHGVDLGALTRPGGYADERMSGFGRIDWQASDRYAVLARAAVTRAIMRDLPFDAGIASPFGVRRDLTTAQASVGVLAGITRRLSAELRFSGDVGDATTDRSDLGESVFADRALVIGGAGDEPANERRTVFRTTAALRADLGAHRLEVGMLFGSHRLEGRPDAAGDGTFAFGDATDLTATSGAWHGLDAHAGSGSFGMRESAFLVQDAWRVSEDLEVTFGFRVDGQTLPVSEIAPNGAFLAASGIDTSLVEEKRTRIAPRLGIRWEFGSARNWVLTGGGGVYHDLPNRRDLAEALSFDQGVVSRSLVGSLGSWPAAPAGAPNRGLALAMLGPDFEGPRTRRAALTLQHDAGAWTLYARGTYRHTDFLARRRDINLPTPSGRADQYGRELSGALTKVGSIIVATPGTNRRFAGFDAVTSIEATGFSTFAGITLGAERVMPAGFTLGVHATYSSTTDNLAWGGTPLAPLPLAADGREWADGLADTHAPLRVISALDWSPIASGAMRVGLVYRGRSGYAFTPRFRPGVDINGDGVSGNDPAFIDGAVPGMTALLDANSCLRRDAGALAERNRCHGDWVHTLDVRASLRLAQLPFGPLDLVVDAMDLLSVETGRIDDALYLVDRAGAMTTNVGTGVTTIPLLANPDFGKVTIDRTAGPLLRVGLRIGR